MTSMGSDETERGQPSERFCVFVSRMFQLVTGRDEKTSAAGTIHRISAGAVEDKGRLL